VRRDRASANIQTIFPQRRQSAMRKFPRGLGLFGGAALGLGLTAAMLLPLPGRGQPPTASQRGPLAPVWSRLSATGHHLMEMASGEPVTARQALERVGAPTWHAAGHRGRGVKVAVLDSGFKGYRAALGTALPARVKARSFRADGNLEGRDSQHGILCAEVIHALAPEAELLLANWEPERPDHFLEAVRWARAEGAQIISCSMIMPTWSDGQGGGPAHAALAAALGARPAGLFFASAGNTAQRHWGGTFHRAANGWHDWGRGRTDNAVRPNGDERISVELYAPGGAGFELVVYDATADREVGRRSSSDRAAVSSAQVRFDPDEGHRYLARARQLDGKPTPFHLVVLGGKLQYANRQGSVPFPGDGPAVVAVGAVDRRGRRLTYSSCGPDGRHKPDLVATVPFPSAWRPDRPFAGTSAAAPQAAALAALVWGRHPGWTADEVRQALQRAARRSPLSPHFWETGHGVIHLPRG
jgi:subtilisin family serine protease